MFRHKNQEKSQQNGKNVAKIQFLVKTAAILDFGPAHFFPGPKAKNFVIPYWDRVNGIQKKLFRK